MMKNLLGLKAIAILATIGIVYFVATIPAIAAGKGELCATIAGIKCDNGLRCEHDANNCDLTHPTGICIVPPKGDCPKELVRSCGCDGKTYPGDCERQKAGVQKRKSGPCSP